MFSLKSKSEMATSDTAELDEGLILDTETPTAIHKDGTNIDKTDITDVIDQPTTDENSEDIGSTVLSKTTVNDEDITDVIDQLTTDENSEDIGSTVLSKTTVNDEGL